MPFIIWKLRFRSSISFLVIFSSLKASMTEKGIFKILLIERN